MRGLIELVVVFAFVLGWAVIELVALRYDRKRTPPPKQNDGDKLGSQEQDPPG
jgi:hypothetical protein